MISIKIMINIKDIDISSLTKEQLISLLNESKNDVDTLLAISKKLADDNSRLTDNNKMLTDENLKLKNEVSELKKQLEHKKSLVTKYNIENYVDNSDNAGNHKKRFSPDEKAKQKVGRKQGSKNYESMDLEKLSSENKIIYNDILNDYMKDHPNAELVKIGEDKTYVIEHVPAKITVHKVITPKYKTKEGTIVQAPSMAIINHSYASANLLGYLTMCKYTLGIPVYRMQDMLLDQGLDFSYHTIYGWLMKTGELLKPVWEALKSEMTSGKFTSLNIDETTLRVMETMDDNRQKCYMYLYSANSDDARIRLFDFTCSRKSDNTQKILSDYKGTITVDGYSGYNSLMSESILVQRCMVHLRREFTDIAKTLNREQRRKSEAQKVIDLIDKIFEAERKIKNKCKTPLDVLAARNTDEYQKLVDDVDDKIDWLDKQTLSISMRKAVNYYMNRRSEYWTYLNDGNVSCHNNDAERQAKSFAALRKGFLFCRSEDSAKSTAVLISLVKTAEQSDLDTASYISWALQGLHDGRKPSDLFPWSKECEQFKLKSKE